MSFAAGIWTDAGPTWSDTDLNLNHRTPEEHQEAVHNSLAVSDEYAWSYGEKSFMLTTTPTTLMQEYWQANEDGHIPTDIVAFNETFDGGFTQVGSSFQSGNGGVGSEVSIVNNDRVQFFNFPSMEGTYQADFIVTADTDYIIEEKFSVAPGAITENAMLMVPYVNGFTANVDVVLEAKQNADGDNSTSTWDIEVTDANGSSLAGLSLSRISTHTIEVHHKGNAANDVELLVNGNLVGTYTGQSAGQDLYHISVGHVSNSVGFTTAFLDDFNIEVLADDLPGDFNGDFVVGGPDIDLLRLAVSSFSTNLLYDVNGDTQVTGDDVTYLITTILETSLGDITLDKRVDSADLAVLRQNQGTIAVGILPWDQGNLLGDGAIDPIDLAILRFHFGYDNALGTSAQAAPEPTTAALLALTSLLAASSRQRRR